MIADDQKEGHKRLSRREFIKDASIVIGTSAIVSLTLSTACKTVGNPETITTTNPPTNASTPDNSTIPTPSPVMDTTPPVTFTSGFTMLAIPGCTTKVAPDRLYSLDNIRVKNLGDNVVQTGITDTFQIMLGLVDTCFVYPPGRVLKATESFGDVEGYKMSVDLISPVSGNIVETNNAVIQHPAELLNGDPYTTGWMLKIHISNPAELNKLVSPLYYAYLHSEGWTNPIPAMH
jgi:glycine cleavage system H protein